VTTLLWILSAFVLALLSVCLSSVEAAFYQLKRRRLGHVAFSNRRVEITNSFLEDPPRLLMPVHMGTYLAHVTMTAILISLMFDRLGFWASGVTLVVMIAYLLTFRLAVPHAISRRNPERVLLLLVPLFGRYFRLMAPLVSMLRRRGATDEAQTVTTAEAPNGMTATTPASAASPDSEERQLQDAVERFATLLVRNVMTARPDIVAVAENTSIADAQRVIADTKLSRLPVFRDNLDDILGVVSVRDLIEHTGEAHTSVAALVRPIHVVPESKRLIDLLRELQKLHATIALVVDEYGGVAGIVSMEDIVEELVGDIEDEYDFEGESIVAEADGAYLVSGRVAVSRVEQALETAFGEGGDVETVGGLVAKVFGRIPRTSESIDFMHFKLEVVDAVPRRVNRVRFRRRVDGDVK
jgi:CBS domain containing-hemolysin-like protein